MYFFLKIPLIFAVSLCHITSCLVVSRIQIIIAHEFLYFSGA